ncbi:sulfatase family protein [Halococcus agarilyticus]|uniref:sulfatase family protein n=1 Tax=Halococcus agarilyticus TaxID=1232219 RepID=UPI00067799DA|nr:sulfatase [Halococcus agarilyticus]
MSSDSSQPNILYVMADDHARNAIGSYGSHLAGVTPTENIDRIAREGVRLDNCCCTNAICTPSRASILTGEYSHRNGVRTLQDSFDEERDHVAHQLRGAGYETALIGKWHLHTQPSGFDYYNVLSGQGRYIDPRLKEKGQPWDDEAYDTEDDDRGYYHTGGGEVHEGYSADVVADQAIEWLDDGRGDGDDPFFMMCHFKAPHDPWVYPDRYEDRYEGQQIPEPGSLFEDKAHRSGATRERGSTVSASNPVRNLVEDQSQDRWPTGTLDTEGMSAAEETRASYQKYLQDYLRTVAALDENVGRLLDHLDAMGLAEDTLVVYTSDQGQLLGEHDYTDKRWIFEESMGMPFLARYPGEIEPDTVAEDLVANVDFAPTFLDYAGVETPTGMQGRSVRDTLENRPDREPRDAVYYRYWMHRAHHDVPAHYGIRTDRFVLSYFYGLPLDAAGAKDDPSEPGWELYDLRDDPHQLRNVYEDPDYANVREDLTERLFDLKESLGDTDDAYPELRQRRKAGDEDRSDTP